MRSAILEVYLNCLCKYSVIQKDGLNYVCLYFLNCTCAMWMIYITFEREDQTAAHTYSQLSCSKHQHKLEVNCGTSGYAWKEIRKSSVNSKQTKLPAKTPNVQRTKRTTQNSKVIFENLFHYQLLKKLAVFYGTKILITILTTAGHLSLSWKRKPPATLKFSYFIRHILILKFNLRLFFKVGSILKTPTQIKNLLIPNMPYTRVK